MVQKCKIIPEGLNPNSHGSVRGDMML